MTESTSIHYVVWQYQHPSHKDTWKDYLPDAQDALEAAYQMYMEVEASGGIRDDHLLALEVEPGVNVMISLKHPMQQLSPASNINRNVRRCEVPGPAVSDMPVVWMWQFPWQPWLEMWSDYSKGEQELLEAKYQQFLKECENGGDNEKVYPVEVKPGTWYVMSFRSPMTQDSEYPVRRFTLSG